MGNRTRSQKRRERQQRKHYEAEHPDLGGYIWQALLLGLLGCLFCAGKDFEEKVEKAKISPEDRDRGDRDGDEGGERRHHRHGRGRSRRSRSRSRSASRSVGSSEADREYRDRNRIDGRDCGGILGGGGGSYVDYDGVTYVPAEIERYRGNEDRVGRYVEEVDESPAPRRRRVRRDGSLR